MQNLLKQLFDKLGRPNEQKSEKLSLAVIYCMFLAFTLVCGLGIVSVSRLSHWGNLSNQSCQSFSLPVASSEPKRKL